MRDRVTRQCPQTTTFEEKGEPKRIRTEVPLLTSLTTYRSAKPSHKREGHRHGSINIQVSWSQAWIYNYIGLMVTGEEAELRSCVKVEVDVLGSYGLCGRKATLQQVRQTTKTCVYSPVEREDHR